VLRSSEIKPLFNRFVTAWQVFFFCQVQSWVSFCSTFDVTVWVSVWVGTAHRQIVRIHYVSHTHMRNWKLLPESVGIFLPKGANFARSDRNSTSTRTHGIFTYISLINRPCALWSSYQTLLKLRSVLYKSYKCEKFSKSEAVAFCSFFFFFF